MEEKEDTFTTEPQQTHFYSGTKQDEYSYRVPQNAKVILHDFI